VIVVNIVLQSLENVACGRENIVATFRHIFKKYQKEISRAQRTREREKLV
jgi:hypothetical protein